jgi:hypothetical protein
MLCNTRSKLMSVIYHMLLRLYMQNFYFSIRFSIGKQTCLYPRCKYGFFDNCILIDNFLLLFYVSQLANGFKKVGNCNTVN